jgi:hypothetical protein
MVETSELAIKTGSRNPYKMGISEGSIFGIVSVVELISQSRISSGLAQRIGHFGYPGSKDIS